MRTLEKDRPGMRPRFLSQKMAQKEPGVREVKGGCGAVGQCRQQKINRKEYKTHINTPRDI
jgi:hypothetical protein